MTTRMAERTSRAVRTIRSMLARPAVLGAVVLIALGAAPPNSAGLVPLHGDRTFRPGGAYPTTRPTTAGPGYASWSGSDANTGTLRSDIFRAPLTLEMQVAGYPAITGLSVVLEREDIGTPHVLRVPANPGEQWLREDFELPLSWYGKPVRLVARDDSTASRGWEGIADLRPLGVRQSLAESRQFAAILAAFGLLAWWMLPGISLAALATQRLALPAAAVFPCALLGSSAICFITFIVSLADPVAGRLVATAAAAGALAAITFPLRRTALALAREADAYWPFIILLASTLAALGLLFASGVGGNLADASRVAFTWPLPADNILPGLLAEHVAQHLPPRPFLGDWLSSDRPPLQAGIDLFARAIVPWGSYESVRYSVVSMLAQCSVLGVVFGLSRGVGVSIRRSLFVTGCVACSGFFLVNAIYVWPKLLAAALAGSGILLSLHVGRRSVAYAAAGLAFGLGMMAHGGVAFTLPALVGAALIRDRLAGLKPLLVGLAVMAAVMAPWSLYAHFVDPPGNRLLKWHLAGRIPVDSLSLPRALELAYSDVPPSRIIDKKLANFRVLAGRPGDAPRANEFFGTFPALAALPFGLVGIAARAWHARRRLRPAPELVYIGIALASLAVWCVVMYGPATTVLHQGSYLSQILLMAGLAIGACRYRLLALVVGIAQLAHFAVVYLVPADPTLSAATALALATIILVAPLVVRRGAGSRIVSHSVGPAVSIARR